MTLPRNVRLPRRIRFRNVSDPPIPDDTPPAYDDPSHTQPPLAATPLPTSSSSRSSLDGTRPLNTVGDLVPSSGSSTSLSFRRNGMDADDQDRPHVTPLEAVDPNLVAMFLEDYRRTKEYVRELEWREARRKLFQRHLYKWYAIIIIVVTLSALLSAKHDSVVRFTEPLTRHIRSWPAGWLIPIAMLIIVSFPPLIGHEIIGILCGLVWGFAEGSGILIAGTFLGEIATWVAFKWFCTTRAKKFEKKNRLYWSLTHLIREKSFMFVLILRFSAVPGHIVTAVSASAGANVWSYCAAAILTLPKQLTITYLGHAFGTENKKNTIISVCTTILTLLMTVVAAVYVYYQMRLLMRRRNLEEAMALPRTVQDLNALSLELDSDVGVGRRRTIQGHRGELGAMAEKIGLDRDLKGAKPWLFAGDFKDGSIGMDDGLLTPGASGSLGRGPQRSRSHPGPMNAGELKAFMTELESQRGTPVPVINLNNELPPMDSRWIAPTPLPGPSRQSQSPDDDGEYIGLSTHVPHITTSRHTRGHSSLDLSPGRSRLGGREIADDADAYARTHGAKRPVGRGRGESRAALLGKPLDTVSSIGSDDGDREYFDKAPFTAPPLSNDEYAESRDTLVHLGRAKTQPRREDGMNKGKEREYGRSRGESRAALLGRPDLEESDGESMKSRRTGT